MFLTGITFKKDHKILAPPKMDTGRDLLRVQPAVHSVIFPKGLTIPFEKMLTVVVGSKYTYPEKLIDLIESNDGAYIEFTRNGRVNPFSIPGEPLTDFTPTQRHAISDTAEVIINKRKSKAFVLYHTFTQLNKYRDCLILIPHLDRHLSIWDRPRVANMICRVTQHNNVQIITYVNDLRMIQQMQVKEVYDMDTFSYKSVKQFDHLYSRYNGIDAPVA